MSEPQGEVVDKYVVGGDNVKLNCTVEYHGPETPYLEWSDEYDNVVYGATEWTDNDADMNPDHVTFVRASQLTVAVPSDAEYLPPYTCTVRFYSYGQRYYYRRYYHYGYNSYMSYYSYENVYTEYNWTSPELKVSCK